MFYFHFGVQCNLIDVFCPVGLHQITKSCEIFISRRLEFSSLARFKDIKCHLEIENEFENKLSKAIDTSLKE